MPDSFRKRFGLGLLDTFGLNTVMRRANRGNIKVLLYHNVTPGGQHFDYALSPEEFERHILYLKARYNIVGIDQLGKWVGVRADKCNVLITFDDGFRNNLDYAVPILKRHGVSAVFFLIADCVKDGSPPDFLRERLGAAADAPEYRTVDIAGARLMIAAGQAVGSHSVSHLNHRRLATDVAVVDGARARDVLEGALGVEIGLFAFPWGYHCANQLEPFGALYQRIFLTTHGFCAPGDTVIPRNEVSGLAHLKAAASGSLDLVKRYAPGRASFGYASPGDTTGEAASRLEDGQATVHASQRGSERSGAALHIALAIPTLAGGGAEQVQIELARGLVARGHRVDLVLLEQMGELLPKVSEGVRIVALSQPNVWRAAARLRAYLLREKPDVTFVSLWPLTVSALLAAIGQPARAIVTVDHNRLDAQFADRPTVLRRVRATVRWLYPRADARIAVSRGVRDYIAGTSGLPASSVEVVYNPIPAPKAASAMSRDRWSPRTHRRRVLTVGKLKRQKNHPLLIDAFKILRERVDAELVIVGNGELEQQTRDYVQKQGMQAFITLPGFSVTPDDWYRGADLFVLSSDHEGLGNVIVEAMHHGVPVVSTNCDSGPAEILEDGRLGRLVPINDARALAAAMEAELADPHPADALKARAAEFSVERAVDRYEDLARRVVRR